MIGSRNDKFQISILKFDPLKEWVKILLLDFCILFFLPNLSLNWAVIEGLNFFFPCVLPLAKKKEMALITSTIDACINLVILANR